MSISVNLRYLCKRNAIILFTTIILTAMAFAAGRKTSEKGVLPMKVNIQIDNGVSKSTLTATLYDNSSSRALVELLQNGSITIDMHDYGNFEKVGTLPKSLPRNDRQITTEAGDIILYQGNQITFYYDTNSWNFTLLGKIDGVTKEELKKILGKGNVTSVLSISK